MEGRLLTKIGWAWDLGSLCHFLLGFSGGLLGFDYAALFAVIFSLIGFEDYRLRLERVIEGTDTKPETWERTKEEYFEFFLGLILASFIRIALISMGA
jgi:hypothetical protein